MVANMVHGSRGHGRAGTETQAADLDRFSRQLQAFPSNSDGLYPFGLFWFGLVGFS